MQDACTQRSDLGSFAQAALGVQSLRRAERVLHLIWLTGSKANRFDEMNRRYAACQTASATLQFPAPTRPPGRTAFGFDLDIFGF